MKPTRWRRPQASDARRAARAGERTARRHSGRPEGRDRGRRPAADLLEQDAREFRFALRRDRHDAPEGCRRRPAGPAEHGRVRDGLVDGKLRVRPDGQSVGSRARARRQLGRLGRRASPRARCRSRSAPTPAARSASRPRCAASSASSPPTASSRATASSPLPRRSTRSGRSRAPSRTPRCCSARSPATTSATRPPSRRTCPTTARSWRSAKARGGSAFRRNISATASIPRSAPPCERRSSSTAQAGCEIREVSLPHAAVRLATYYIIATAEASSNLARYDGIRYGHRSAKAKDVVDLYFQSRAEGFGAEVKRRIILGTYVLEQRLLRRLLPARAEGPHADPPGFHRRATRIATRC